VTSFSSSKNVQRINTYIKFTFTSVGSSLIIQPALSTPALLNKTSTCPILSLISHEKLSI
ncbi:hypothetical protein Q0M07_14710, partial [Staphylococcus aureus]|nr:hypothetical protein [Staphylococcus aureus]